MTPDMIQILGAAATLYGLGGALSVLLQARRMLVRGTSGDVSASFFAVYVGGFAIWLLYGIGIGDVPIILVHAVGLVCGTVTLAVTLRLRRTVAQDATVRSTGEDEAQRLPIQPPLREPEYRPRTVGDRVRGRWDDRAPAARDVAEEICV
jgi:MtN3 and saliva related transmembrane protein